MSRTEILVCTTCRPSQQLGNDPPAGRILLQNLQDLMLKPAPAGSGPAPSLRGIACLSGCSRACTVALQAPGKHAYVFGQLQADAETALQVLSCAALHQQSADGLLPRSARPERLRNGIVARLPPLQQAAAGDERSCGQLP